MKGWENYGIESEQEFEDFGEKSGNDFGYEFENESEDEFDRNHSKESENDFGEEFSEKYAGKFEATYDQKIHSSEQNECGEIIIKEPGKDNEYKRRISQLDHVDRLKQFIGGVVYTLNNNNILTISSSDRNEICRSVDSLSHINIEAKYVNPLAYVLGYVANTKKYIIEEKESSSNRQKKIRDITSNIFDHLEQINNVVGGGGVNYAVYPADVIRYMRLWNKKNFII